MPIVTERPRTAAQFAEFALDMSLRNPSGFRHCGRNGSSLVQDAAIAAGMLEGDDLKRERSARGLRKARRRRRYLEALRLERRLRDAYRLIPGNDVHAPVAPRGFTERQAEEALARYS